MQIKSTGFFFFCQMWKNLFKHYYQPLGIMHVYIIYVTYSYYIYIGRPYIYECCLYVTPYSHVSMNAIQMWHHDLWQSSSFQPRAIPGEGQDVSPIRRQCSEKQGIGPEVLYGGSQWWNIVSVTVHPLLHVSSLSSGIQGSLFLGEVSKREVSGTNYNPHNWYLPPSPIHQF